MTQSNKAEKKAEKPKILPPKIPLQLEKIDLSQEQLENDFIYSLGSICDCTLGNGSAEHGTFEKMTMRNVNFENSSLPFLELTDVVFENCNLSNGIFSGAVIHRVVFRNCKMIGMNLSDSTLRNVLFENCNGNYAFFRFSNLGQVRFQNCQLQNADFASSHFSQIDFDDSNLVLAQMSGTKLRGVDFSAADIEGLGCSTEDLVGAIIAPYQAVSLAKKMGLVIKE